MHSTGICAEDPLTTLAVLRKQPWQHPVLKAMLVLLCTLYCMVRHGRCPAGITESFVHAVLEPAALRAANALLVVFTASHVVASVVLVQLGGAAGLVAADGLNAALRIAYSLW